MLEFILGLVLGAFLFPLYAAMTLSPEVKRKIHQIVEEEK